MRAARVLIGVSVVFCCIVFYRRVSENGPADRFDLTAVRSGEECRLIVMNREIVVSVPRGESMSIGSFKVSDPDLNYESGSIERDGALEALWVSDVTNDKQEDLIVVTRSAGSGGYTQINVFESNREGYRIRRLPEISSSIVSGYMGHEKVSVYDSKIIASFPTFHSSARTRVDLQWELKDGVDGTLPIKNKPDSNSDPSGKTVRLTYDFRADTWTR